MIKLRLAKNLDCRILWHWANDPAVRFWSFQSDEISWKEHTAWFRQKMSDPKCCLYIVIDRENTPIGQVRFDVEMNGAAEVSISIQQDRRSQGYGSEALRLACMRFREHYPATEIIAGIKLKNAVSIRVFNKAGFAVDGKARRKKHEAVRMRFMKHEPHSPPPRVQNEKRYADD